jgi:hypothetical protein
MPSTRVLPWIMAVGGAGAIVSAFLPWISVSSRFAGTVSSSATDRTSSVFAVVLGVAVLAIGGLLAAGRRVDPVLTIAAPALLAIFMVIEFTRSVGRIAQLNEDSFLLGVQARPGTGLWLLLASALLAVMAAVALLQLRRRAIARGQA